MFLKQQQPHGLEAALLGELSEGRSGGVDFKQPALLSKLKPQFSSRANTWHLGTGLSDGFGRNTGLNGLGALCDSALLKVRTLKLLCNSLLTSASQQFQFQLLLPLLHHSSYLTLLIHLQLNLTMPCPVCQDNNIIFGAVKTCQPEPALKGKLQAAGGISAGLGTAEGRLILQNNNNPSSLDFSLPVPKSNPSCSS